MGRMTPWQRAGVPFSDLSQEWVRDPELVVEYVLHSFVRTAARPEGSSILSERTSKNPAR